MEIINKSVEPLMLKDVRIVLSEKGNQGDTYTIYHSKGEFTRTLFFNGKISTKTIPDGYNGDTVEIYAEQIAKEKYQVVGSYLIMYQ